MSVPAVTGKYGTDEVMVYILIPIHIPINIYLCQGICLVIYMVWSEMKYYS